VITLGKSISDHKKTNDNNNQIQFSVEHVNSLANETAKSDNIIRDHIKQLPK